MSFGTETRWHPEVQKLSWRSSAKAQVTTEKHPVFTRTVLEVIPVKVGPPMCAVYNGDPGSGPHGRYMELSYGGDGKTTTETMALGVAPAKIGPPTCAEYNDSIGTNG